MKQKLWTFKLFAVFLLIFSANAWGQFFESFETGLPAGYSNTTSYTLTSGVWTGSANNVMGGNTGVTDGSKSLQLRSQTGANVITPTLSGGVSTISFDVTASTATGAYQINISNDNGVNWTPAPGSPFQVGLTTQAISIDVNDPQINRIQIRRTGGTLYFDNFSVMPANTNVPSITVTPLFLSNFNYGLGSGPSAEQSFTVEGSNLTENITVTPPTNYEISTTSGSGFTIAPVSIVQTGGSVASTPVYVRLAAGLPVGNYTGTITLASAGATSVNVDLTGDVVTAPTVTASSQTGTVGTPFTYQVQATENPTSYAISSGTLPAGLTLDNTTGIISGTPTATGTFSIDVTATNTVGTSTPATISISIAQGAQTATLSNINVNVGAAAQNLPNTTDQGQSITYTSSDPAVASVLGNTLTFGIAGTATISASAAASSDYLPFSETFDVIVISPPILEFEFFGISGDETSSSSSANNSNLTSSTITRGSGLTASNNADRFNATSWALNDISSAVNGNDYMEFTITPNSGFQFDVTSILFNIARSGTGLSGIALRSSLDNFSTNLDGEKTVLDNTNTQQFTFTFSQAVSNTPVTYRLYGYAESTGGSGGIGDGSGPDIMVYGNVLPVISSAIIWDGAAWSNTTGPDATFDAVIAGNYIGSSFEANSLTINSGNTLTLNSGTTVTTNGNVINNGDIVVADGGNFIQTSTSTYDAASAGTFTVNKTASTTANLYTFWSSPVAGQSMYGIFPGQTVSSVVEYATATDAYTAVTSPASSVSGKGYGVRVPAANAPVSFVGIPNNGLQTLGLINTVSTNGNTWNLIGNPYPSNLSLTALYNTNSSAVGSTFYLYNLNASDRWGTFNAVSSTWARANAALTSSTASVEPGQAFIAEATGTSISFDNSMRNADPSVFVNKSTAAGEGKFWLELRTSGLAVSGAAITYGFGGLDTFDPADSKVMSVGNNSLFSLQGTAKLAIQGKSAFSDTDIIALGNRQLNDAPYTIALAATEGLFANGQAIYLHDKQLGIFTNLQLGSYSFQASAGEQLNRFEILYQPQAALGVAETAGNHFTVYRDGEAFVVKSTEKIIAVTVYDSAGRLIRTLKPNAKEAAYYPVSKGVYILKIKSESKETTAKILK